MIRFCDKEVFTLSLVEIKNMSKNQLLSLMKTNSNHSDDVFLIYDENGEYYGLTDYNRVSSKDDYIEKKYFMPSDDFWNEAKLYFAENRDAEVIILNNNKEPLGFCYSDKHSYSSIEERLVSLERLGDDIPVPVFEMNRNMKIICMFDLNEYAWRLYKIFKRYDWPVCVTGEKWSWFGIKTMDEYDTFPSYSKMYIYAEGSGFYRGKGVKDSVSVYDQFKWIMQWGSMNLQKIYAQEINKLLEKNISVCKVSVPLIKELDKEKFAKGDLINQIEALPWRKLSDNELVRARQRDFFGSAAYEIIEKKERPSLQGWKTVLYTRLHGEKLCDISEKKRIYVIGPCIVASFHSLTEDSLISQIQKLVSGYEVIKIFCLNCDMDVIKYGIEKLPIREDDIIIFINESWVFELDKSNCPEVNLKELYNKTRTKTWFMDNCSMHINSIANKAIAQEIYDKYLKEKINDIHLKNKNHYLQKGQVLSDEMQQEILTYVNMLKKSVGLSSEWKTNVEKIGSIVMNCNPFTRGHLYLIEKASSQVDLLYIFVVQEDKSFFTFEDRYELVKAGTKHLENVIVVPSGEHVLSYKTLPTYFEKEKEQTAVVDASHDIEIFARYIAPKLGITYRFAGEEPIDNVTRQYNEQMADILPEFGIEFVEIPRKTTVGDKEVISASRVRKLMKDEQWEAIKELVPETTFNYLFKKYRAI